MNVASKDLSQELYELTKWGSTEWATNFETDKVWMVYSDGSNADNPYLIEPTYPVMLEHVKGENEITPAYSLGYLLRKLPKGCFVKVARTEKPFYFAEYEWNNVTGETWGTGADTPEDAATKLCIELIKQGVISPNGEPK